MVGISTNIDSAGGLLIESQNGVTIEGNPVIVDNDSVTGHGLPPHASPTMVAGDHGIFIEGVKVVAEGDFATCGHTSTGNVRVTVG